LGHHRRPTLGRAPLGLNAELSADDQREVELLWQQHQPLNALVVEISPYLRMLAKRPWPLLPLRESEYRWKDDLPPDLLDITGYRELMEAAIEHGNDAALSMRRELTKR
jgi:hypothetical protein